MIRTLVRFDRVGKQFALVVVPGWRHDRFVAVHLDRIPEKIRKQVRSGFRCYATANLDAVSALDLNIGQWEERLSVG